MGITIYVFNVELWTHSTSSTPLVHNCETNDMNITSERALQLCTHIYIYILDNDISRCSYTPRTYYYLTQCFIEQRFSLTIHNIQIRLLYLRTACVNNVGGRLCNTIITCGVPAPLLSSLEKKRNVYLRHNRFDHI